MGLVTGFGFGGALDKGYFAAKFGLWVSNFPRGEKKSERKCEGVKFKKRLTRSEAKRMLLWGKLLHAPGAPCTISNNLIS